MGDTIFARSSGDGRAGIAVWRISGPKARNLITALTGRTVKPRFASHRKVRDQDGTVLDDGLVLFFPGPQSATGEDLAEFHLHGSPAIGRRLADLLVERGLRPAKPGEFTLRALENGKMDLLAVEALGDLLDAQTEAQRRQAASGRAGVPRETVERWRHTLITTLGTLEAGVDFPDEEDIPAEITSRALPLLKDLRVEIADAVRSGAAGRRLREGLKLAIVGPPNAGKSSLMNRLLGEDRAIVSDRAGTTRDVISSRLELRGRPIELLDTAGLRDHTEDEIEREGMARTLAIAAEADIIVTVRDAVSRETTQFEPTCTSGRVIRVVNKIDLSDAAAEDELQLSVRTGEGWEVFLDALGTVAEEMAAPSFFPRERQQLLLRDALIGLERMTGQESVPPELLAEDVRSVISRLDELVGRITPDDVLGSIFSSFCIGK